MYGFALHLISECTEYVRILESVRVMGTIVKTKEGSWRALVRRKGKYASQTFKLKTLANEWVVETERLIDIGAEPYKGKIVNTGVNFHHSPE